MNRLPDVFTGVLVLGAVVVLGLLAHREFARHQARHRAEVGVAVPGWSSLELQTGMSPDREAPVRIAVFADYTCRYCTRLEAALDSVAPALGERLEVAHVNYPLYMDGTPLAAAIASECSRAQGRLPAYHQLLYANQANLDTIGWEDLAAEAGITDIAGFRACLEDPAVREEVVRTRALGDSIGVSVTPTMVVNGRLFPGAPAATVLQKRLLRALDGA